jgi:basic amino acid/polyamine antiporter, APA family
MSSKPYLNRALGLYATTAVVIGSVVGSGIFSSPSGMARTLESAPLLLFVWLLGGIFTAFGAMTQCELVGQMPKTGGMFVYLKEIYGERIGFLYGWANLMIAGSGAIAGISSIFAAYAGEFISLPKLSPSWESIGVNIPILGTLYPFADIGVKLLGASVIVILTLLNIRGVKVSGRFQSITTSSKLLAIVAIAVIALIAGGSAGSSSNWFETSATTSAMGGWEVIGIVAIALSGAFWAYDGWGTVAYLAGEVKEPSKTIPRAILLGSFIFITLYLLVNLAYLYILPVGTMATVEGDRVASAMTSEVIGGVGAALIAGLIMLSTFDATNSTILTNARCYFAMAHANLFWRKTGKVHEKYKTPHVSLMMQGGWAIVLLFSGSFWTIIDMYVFVNWMVYILMGLGVFIMRRRYPDRERAFKVPGYPVIPALFVLFAITFVTLSLTTDIQNFSDGKQPFLNSVMGILLVLSGLPLYYLWKYKNRDKSIELEEFAVQPVSDRSVTP